MKRHYENKINRIRADIQRMDETPDEKRECISLFVDFCIEDPQRLELLRNSFKVQSATIKEIKQHNEKAEHKPHYWTRYGDTINKKGDKWQENYNIKIPIPKNEADRNRIFIQIWKSMADEFYEWLDEKAESQMIHVFYDMLGQKKPGCR